MTVLSQRFLASCLRVEIDGATKQWLESRPAMSAACERLDSMIDDVIRRYRATKSESLERGAILAFIDSLAAIEAAAALIFVVSKEQWKTRTPIKVKVAVRTGMIESRRDGVGGQIVDLCSMQLARTYAGQATICETTRNLLHGELPPDIDLDDLGRVQIDENRPPERMFALRVAGIPSPFDAGVLSKGGNHNMPPRLTSFVGRDADIEALERRLRSDRFLTIVGPGGSGKTSLSRELGRHFAMEFPDGAWFVPLAEVTDDAGLLRTVKESLHELLGAGTDSTDSIYHEIGDRSFLLVLDNLEQVRRPAARFIHKLLTFCVNVRVLATSRHSVGATGEQVHHVRPFSTADLPEDDLAALIENPAIRLFVDRARAVDHEFALTKQNAASILSICRSVEGLPLAIEHVASNVGRLSLPQIEKTLAESLLALKAPEDSVAPRHSTMRTTVHWSLALLSDGARALSSALLTFSGGWTVEAACALALALNLSEEQALSAHGELVDGSLIVKDHGAADLRYRYPEAVKQTLLEAEPPTEATIEAHARWYFKLAASADAEMLGERQSNWVRRLEAEFNNLRVALKFYWERWTAESPEFVSAMRRFWLRARLHSEAMFWFENALSVAGPDRGELRATLLNALGACHYRIGEPDTATRYYEESRAIWERESNHSELGAVCTNLAMCKIEKGDVGEALKLSEMSCLHYEYASDTRGLGSALMNLGWFQGQLGDWAGAETSLARATDLLESTHHEAHLCFALANRSYVAWKTGDHGAYHTLVEKQIELIERSHDVTIFGTLVLGLAACATEVEDLETVQQSIEALHGILGPNPRFNSHLHSEQYEQAIRLAGKSSLDVSGQKSEFLDWPETVIKVRAIANAFSQKNL